MHARLQQIAQDRGPRRADHGGRRGRDHNDAGALSGDPALRLGVSDRAGTAPLGRALASQPTLSRVAAALGKGKNAKVLRDGLARFAGWRMVASVGETGDLLDVRLRKGAVHTAEGGLGFIVGVLDRAERFLCEKAMVRFDAGYPGEELMAALEARGTHYVARVRNNAVLKRLALPAVDALVCEAAEPYRAGTWSRTRRVVQVLVEEPGELFPRTFWLLTSLSADQVTGEELLAMYRQRGKAVGPHGRADERGEPGVVVVAPSEAPLPRPAGRESGTRHRRLRLQRGAPASRRLRLPDHARPARRPRTRDRHRVEPEAAARAGAARPGPLHRLRPPDRHDRECGLAALASPGPPAPAPARTRGVAFRDRRGSEGGGRRGIRVPGTGIRWPYRRIESRKPLQNGVLGAHLGVR